MDTTNTWVVKTRGEDETGYIASDGSTRQNLLAARAFTHEAAVSFVARRSDLQAIRLSEAMAYEAGGGYRNAPNVARVIADSMVT